MRWSIACAREGRRNPRCSARPRVSCAGIIRRPCCGNSCRRSSALIESRICCVKDAGSIVPPPGGSMAAYLGEEPLAADEIGAASAGSPGHTPLWYYILREADARSRGSRLGPVGARIVGEVLIGLLDLDPTSVRHAPKDRQPNASLVELLTGSAFSGAAAWGGRRN